MREWLTAQQIADLGLPGYPASKRGVLDLAAREGWAGQPGLSRASSRRGGGLEFHVDLLPAGARSVVAVHAIGRVAVPDRLAHQAAAEPEALRLTAGAAEHRDARLALLAAVEKFRAAQGLGQVVADRLFCTKYTLGTIPVDDWIRRAVPDLAVRTLHRWRAAAAAGTLTRLAVDPGARRRGKGALEQEDIRTFILGCIARQPHLSSDHVRTLVGEQFPRFDLPAPRTFRLALTVWRERYKVELAKLTSPDAFRNKYRVAGTNSHQVSRLNELWMIDASPADVLTVEGRHSIYACIDIYSRRIQVYVTRTPRAEAVGLLMRRSILAWGMPERVKTDNGSDFRAKRTLRLMASLGIEVEPSTAFSPWEKGHVERAIKTLQHDCMTLLPGFIGHSVADRKVIEERRAFAERLGETDDNVFCVDLTPAELQAQCDSWANGRYASRPHDGLNGATPQAAAAGYVGNIRTVELHALDVLLAPIAGSDGLRTVSKRGIRVENRHYLTPTVLPETRVLVRMDPADMGRVWLFAEDGEEFLGEGVCPELAGIDPAEFVATTRAAQNAMLREGTAAIRASMKSLTHRDVADMILRKGAKDAGVLVEFPRATVAHTTPALEAAALVTAEPAEVIGFPAQRQPIQVAPIAPAEPEGITVLHPNTTPKLRYRRALAIEAAMASGGNVTAEDGFWLGQYQSGAEYRTMKAAVEDFGEAALR